MSISIFSLVAGIALSPAILITRVAVGKEKFDAWLNSNYVKYQADFKSKEEWKQLIIDAGYDVVSYAGSYKTHLSEKKHDFFWWEIQDDLFVAEFNMSDKVRYESFMSQVERVAQRKLFTPVDKAHTETTQHEATPSVELPSYPASPSTPTKALFEEQNDQVTSFSTIYSDSSILEQTLAEYGVSYSKSDSDSFELIFDKMNLIFSRSSCEEPYELTLKSNSAGESVLDAIVKTLTPEYLRIAQERAYLQIKEKCQQSDFEIIEEDVLDDNSILLTISVQITPIGCRMN